jgi:hypothetical protein
MPLTPLVYFYGSGQELDLLILSVEKTRGVCKYLLCVTYESIFNRYAHRASSALPLSSARST